ncbi:MAG: LamG domain-containing protein [Bryobacteraceae bacterium]|nr:LamG domain-containing protein [Bryobacteraceae bacterium]
MRRLVPILLVCVSALPAQVFRAGAYEVDVSPTKFPILLSGSFLARYGDRAEGSICARALALDDGTNRVVLVVSDTLMIPRDLADRAKLRASRATGVPPVRMLISATHTHSTPPLMGALGTPEEPEYARLFEDRLVEAIEGAVKRLQPARVGWTVTEDFDHTHCRRWILRSDHMRKDPFGDLTVRAHMHPGYQNPEFVGPAGPVDPDLSLLSIQTANGEPLALLANYSMHYVGVPGRVASADYYGPFVENMRRKIGPSLVAMMSQGTSGDQHWMDYSRPRVEMNIQKYADSLAEVAYRAYRKIQYRSWAPVAMRETSLKLSRRLPDDKRLAWAKAEVARLGGKPPSNQPEVYACEQVYLAASPVRELVLQAVRIGELGITAIPNEVFGITGLKIKAQSPLTHTMNIELANGAEGYIPPPEQHKLGGYTTWPARTAGLEVGAEPKIVSAVLGLLEQVSGKPRRPVSHIDGTYAKAVLASRPAAYWRGSEFAGPLAKDASGNGHSGNYEDGVAFYLEGPQSPAFSGSIINRAPHYAGGRMKAEVKGLPENYTAEFWFYNGLPTGVRPITGYLFSRGADTLAVDGNGRIQFSNGDTTLVGRTPVALLTWTHAALVRSGDAVRVYLNGREEVSGKAAPAGGDGILIGGRPAGDSNFEGRIDEVALYGRILSPAEVAKRAGHPSTRQ